MNSILGSYQEVIDISPLISPETAVFPGDTPFSRDVLMDFPLGDHLGLSAINTTVHIGAHTDAPNHYHKDGVGIDQRDLAIYLGDCQVIEVNCPKGSRINKEDLPSIESSRILIKTNSFPNPNQWNSDFNALSPELVHFCADQGVKLIGIDTPSVDLADDKELISHSAIYSRDMAILEGIVLQDVQSGPYFLIALPLKLKGVDASPVRAVLLR